MDNKRSQIIAVETMMQIDMPSPLTEVSTIASSAPIGSSGKGSYSWFVPTTFVSGSDYKVSVQSVTQPNIKDSSNANFKISWA